MELRWYRKPGSNKTTLQTKEDTSKVWVDVPITESTHQPPEGKTSVSEHRPNFDGRNNILDRKKVSDKLTSMYVSSSIVPFLVSNNLGLYKHHPSAVNFITKGVWEWNYDTLKILDIEVLKFLIVQLKIYNDK